MKHVAILAALLLPPAALASDLDALVAKVVDTYGGSTAWAKVTSIDETGRVDPAMRKGPGAMTRKWSGAGNLRVEIVYPDKTEVRALENGKGTNNGRESSAMELDGMRLQAARLALPRLLADKKASLRDLGTKDNIRSVEIALDAPLTVTVDIDTVTGRIVRSVGRAKDVAFTTEYNDFRTVSGLLIAFHEGNSAMGMKTADIYLEKVEIK
jgi:hypothetical protein